RVRSSPPLPFSNPGAATDPLARHAADDIRRVPTRANRLGRAQSQVPPPLPPPPPDSVKRSAKVAALLEDHTDAQSQTSLYLRVAPLCSVPPLSQPESQMD